MGTISHQASEHANPVDFTGLILAFSSAALQFLGETMVEGQEPGNRDLAMAKQNIDIIAMLKDKTRGNLNNEEEQMIGAILQDLQMRFVSSATPATRKPT